jgi:succinate dehydrogenase hydrophobic anchor subunit
MTARLVSQWAAGFVLGLITTWLLGVVTGMLLLPFVVVAVVAAMLWRQGLPNLAASAVAGAASTTLFFLWLFATLGDGLATM